MRILLPYNTNLGEFNTEIIRGGIEKFCNQIVQTFNDVHILNIDNNNPIKENTTKIKDYAKKINADIIISNWGTASFAGAKIVDSEIPIMFISHGCIPFGSVLSTISRLREKGHAVYMVSKWQNNWYRQMSKRMGHPDEIKVDGYINSGYVQGKKPKLLPIEYDCCTIGRCEPVDKKPFLLKEWLQKWDYNTIVLTNTPTDKRGIKYLNRNSHWSGVLFDLKYQDVMKELSKSKYYFATMYIETWGITVLESLAHGVPVILRSKDGTHAAIDVCSDEKHYKLVSNNIELSEAIKSSHNLDRKEIQDMTWDKHSYDKWKSHFENCIDKTIENFKKRYPIKKYMS